MTAYGYGTVEQIMKRYGVSRAYVYKMASARRWGRYRHPEGGVRYRLEDADDTLSDGAARRDAQRRGKVRD